MSSASVPSVMAMLICDQIINEQGTNKKSLMGVFQQVNAPGFPVMVPRMAVYVRLADVMENTVFKLRIVKLTGFDESLIAEAPLEIVIQDPTKPAELGFQMLNFVFPEAGKYEFQLYAEDIYLQRVTMDAVQIQA